MPGHVPRKVRPSTDFDIALLPNLGKSSILQVFAGFKLVLFIAASVPAAQICVLKNYSALATAGFRRCCET